MTVAAPLVAGQLRIRSRDQQSPAHGRRYAAVGAAWVSRFIFATVGHQQARGAVTHGVCRSRDLLNARRHAGWPLIRAWPHALMMRFSPLLA